MTTMADKIWFYLDSQNQQKGPFSEQEIQGFYQQGILFAESFVWKNGLENWQSLSTALPHLAKLPPSTLSFDREPAPASEPAPFAAQNNNTSLRQGQNQRVLKGRKLTTKEILFSFEGRLPRKPFWLTYLAIVALYFVIGILAAIILPATRNSGLGWLFVLIGLPLFVVSIWASVAIGVKRLHDRDMTGWFYLLNFIPYVGGLIFLIICCFKGTDGTNKFGEDTTHLY